MIGYAILFSWCVTRKKKITAEEKARILVLRERRDSNRDIGKKSNSSQASLDCFLNCQKWLSG